MGLQRFSRTCAGITLLAALSLSVPPFFASPLWVDATHYDEAARNLLAGGAPYRDVFDTNLPGMVWAHAVVRTLLGWRPEALRLADAALMTAVVALLMTLARRAGASAASAWWLAAGAALFYPFTTEFSHCQRDAWMLLPALLAVRQRLADSPTDLTRVAEGALWGAAVWLKPHALAPAAAVWLASRPAGRRDAAAVLAGGVLAGLAGAALLASAGGWGPFWDVMTRWNPEYGRATAGELPRRLTQVLDFFPPWGYLHLAAGPLAVAELARGGRPRRVLAALYLGWWGQALALQKGLDYVHVPVILLGLTQLAARGVPAGLLALPALALLGGPPMTAGTVERFRVGARALADGPAPADRDRLSGHRGVHCCTEWVPLTAAAEFLRGVRPPPRDGELLCWNDSTHPLYAILGVRPAVRFLHLGTVWDIAARRPDVEREVRAARPRYVVADLARLTWERGAANGGDPGALPPWFPASQRGVFPWDQPLAFRAGRYAVFEVTRPVGRIDIPAWESVGELGGP